MDRQSLAAPPSPEPHARANEPAKTKKPNAAKKGAKPSKKAPAGSKHKSRAPVAPKPEVEAADATAGPDQACHVQLRKAGVSFEKLSSERAPNVELPIRLTGSVAGVEIRGAGKNKATHYLDCRLALTLVRWAPALLAAGVIGIDHYSIYRPEAHVSGTRKASGHASALAIDAARFHLRDGRVLNVLDNWKDKTKGADPCAPHPQQDADERLLRDLTCDASRMGLFQTVVTPHHNPEHNNHVHLEISTSFSPTWIH